MNKKWTVLFVVIILVVLGGGIYWIFKPEKVDPKIDALAQCLTDKKTVMYGAYWCPHCQNQKKDFGASFDKVTYVECTQDIQKCKDAKIEGYPTWINSEGKRVEGEQSFEDLAKLSGCAL